MVAVAYTHQSPNIAFLARSSSEEQIPGHGIVLCAGSEVFKGELERWSGSGRPSVVLRVEPEQVQPAPHMQAAAWGRALPGTATGGAPLVLVLLLHSMVKHAHSNAPAPLVRPLQTHHAGTVRAQPDILPVQVLPAACNGAAAAGTHPARCRAVWRP